MSECYSKSTIKSFLTYGISSNCTLTPANVMTILNAIPTVDAEPIVRCKDCKYAHMTVDGYAKYCDMRKDQDGNCDDLYLPGDWFCADGEKRNEQSNPQTTTINA